MARTKEYTLVGTAASAAAYVSAGSLTEFVPLTLLAAAATISPASQVAVAFSAETTCRLGIHGLNENGNPIAEVIAYGQSLTVNKFSSITKIVPDRTVTQTVNVGTILGARTPWTIISRGLGQDQVPVARCVAVTTAGVPTGNWEVTLQPFPNGLKPDDVVADDTQAWVSGTAVQVSGTAVRYVLTSGTGTGVKVRVVRAGPAG